MRKKKIDKKEKTISMKIHKELYNFLNKYAKENFKTKTEIITDLILEKYKNEMK